MTETPLPEGGFAQSLHLKLPVDAETGAAIEYVYTLRPDNYMVDFDINFIGMQEYTSNLTFFNFDWGATTLQNEKGYKNENMNTTLAYRYPGAKKIEQLGASEGHRGKEIKTKVNWVSFKQQFFASVLIAREDFTADAVGFDTKSE